MKKLGGVLIMGTVTWLGAYQPPEQGLFYAHVSPEPAYQNQGPKRVFERRSDGIPSAVQCINGVTEFNQNVVVASLSKPVLIKVYATQQTNTQVMDGVFQDAAEAFGDRITFVALDVTQQREGSRENYELLCHLLVKDQNLAVRLPFFILFQSGSLCSIPSRAPEGVAQDIRSKEGLEALVKDVLVHAQTNNALLTTSSMDMMSTTTSDFLGSRGRYDKKQATSWWQRAKKWWHKNEH